MRNWATLPYELLQIIVQYLSSDTKALKQFQLVCKHWNQPSAYITFDNCEIYKLDRLSSLVRLILHNRKIGLSIKRLWIDFSYEEQFLKDELRTEEYLEEEEGSLLRESVEEFEQDREKTCSTLFKLILRYIPNATIIRFLSDDAMNWYITLQENASYLKNVKELQPPVDYNSLLFYNAAAWELHATLKKATFVNINKSIPDAAIYSVMGLNVRAKRFTNVEEIRIEVLESRLYVSSLESVINALPRLEFVVFSAKIMRLHTGVYKVAFSDFDPSDITPLLKVDKLRCLQCYFTNDNAIKYITQKFPNVYELRIDLDDSPWEFFFENDIPNTPNRISPAVQTLFFEYLAGMYTFDVFGFYTKDDIPTMLSRWMAAVENYVKDQISLTLTNEEAVQTDCAYVYWKKHFRHQVYETSIFFRDASDWQYARFVQSLGRCVHELKLNELHISSPALTQIYEACPRLERLECDSITIPNTIDVGETTNILKEVVFKNMEASSTKRLSDITSKLPSLYTLKFINCDITVPKEGEPTEDNRCTFKDLEFDISASHPHRIKYVPTHEFIPPWCFIINDKRLLIVPDAFEDGPTKHTVFTREVPLEEFDEWEKKIAPSKRDFRYCVRIKCENLHCFNFSKNYEQRESNTPIGWDWQDPKSDDNLDFVVDLSIISDS